MLVVRMVLQLDVVELVVVEQDNSAVVHIADDQVELESRVLDQDKRSNGTFYSRA
jgi:hypothetical protein